jgi:hypothetical protein
VNKVTVLGWAECIDAYRVFPRLFLAICLAWSVALNYELMRWYMHLPHEERGLEASGFASIAFVAVMGFLKLVYTTYSSTGRDWNLKPGSTTIESASVSTTSSP